MKSFEQINKKPHLIDISNPRIGVVTLSTDFTIEQDYRRICHNLPVDIFVNRIPFENPCTHENYLKMYNYLPSIVEQILPKQKIGCAMQAAVPPASKANFPHLKKNGSGFFSYLRIFITFVDFG